MTSKQVKPLRKEVLICGSRDSVDGMVTRLRVVRPRNRGSIPSKGKRFSHFQKPRQAIGPTQPPVQSAPAGFFVVVNRPGLEADHSPQSDAEVKNALICTSTPPYEVLP
jgi:hypothetical protein